MTQHVQDIMTKQVHTVRSDTPLLQVARLMREKNIGDVLVLEPDSSLRGIVTDRDIVVRAVAVGKPLDKTTAAEVCSNRLLTLSPTASVEDAIKVMKEHGIRRIPVVRDNKPIGIVTLGDLARHRDPSSALGQISSAAPNN
jgi:CBS domain-containing protein